MLAKPQIRIGIADNQPLFRKGLSLRFKSERDFHIVGETATGSGALSLVRTRRPSLLIMDFQMQEAGIELVPELLRIDSNLKLMLLTSSHDMRHASQGLMAGAAGYAVKSISGDDLVAAVRAMSTGGQYVMPELAARLIAALSTTKRPAAPSRTIELLNKREVIVLSKAAVGATNKEIARALGIAEKTVKHYMTSLMQKLGVRNRVEAVSLLMHEQGHPERET